MASADVRVQEDFSEHPDTLLDQLDEYIRGCDAIIHLMGDANGSNATQSQVDRLFEKYPNFLARYPDLRRELRESPVASYTQWEAYLALHHGRSLYAYVYVPADKAEEPTDMDRGMVEQSSEDAQRQWRHLERIKELGIKRGTLISVADLNEKVLTLDSFGSGDETKQPSVWNAGFAIQGSRPVPRADAAKAARLVAGTAAITTKPHAVHGAGGIGKTRAAIEYAWQYEIQLKFNF